MPKKTNTHFIQTTLAELVQKLEGKDYKKPVDAYKFSKRTFKDTGSKGGIYKP